MLRRCKLLVLAALMAHAEEPTAAQKARARKLLDQTTDMVAAATPAVQVLLARDLGELYQKLDKKKSVKLLTEAFSATPSLKAEHRDVQQGKILARLAEVDLDAAIERVAIYQPADPEAKPALYENLVRTLVQREKTPVAVELFETYSGGNYPFKALDILLTHLPADDPRQVILFGRATTAYGASGGGAFPELLARRAAALPRESVQGAVGMLLSRVADAKFAKGESVSLSGEKGPVVLQTAMDAVVFDTAHVIAMFEPKRLDEILATRPALRSALERYPKGRASLGGNTASMSASGDDQSEQRAASMIGPFAAEQQFLQRVADAAKKDPREAIKLADEVKDADLKARALGTVVETLHKDDPAAARAVIARAIEMLPKLERPMSVLSLLTVAFDEESAKLLTPQLQQQLIEAFFSSIGKFLKRDLDPDLPNLADRDDWPSTQLMRAVMMSVGAEQPDIAEPLLEQVKDTELRLLAQVALARGLLGEQLKSLNMNFVGQDGKLPPNVF
jgi:tetratricopeptide (TPR) repeat protein